MNAIIEVSKSSADCAARNLANKESIDLGLEPEWKPNAQALKIEAEEAARVKAGFKLATDKLAVLKMLDPNVTDANASEVCGVAVRIEETYRNAINWSRGTHSGWKMILGSPYGSRDDKKWLFIGYGTQLGLNAKQLAKAKEHIAYLQAQNSSKQTAAQIEAATQARYKAFISVPERKALVGAICNTTSVSEYGEKNFSVEADGSLKYNYETFTVAQWTEIVALKNAQKAAMQALKDSFKPISANA